MALAACGTAHPADHSLHAYPLTRILRRIGAIGRAIVKFSSSYRAEEDVEDDDSEEDD
jgi:hypothetical protein